MPKTRIITVVKVPLIASEKIDKPAIFPPMPTMFLELFENKSKLRRDYVNKGYKENEDEIKKSPKPTSKKRMVKNKGATSTQPPVGQRQPPEDLSKSAVVVEPPPTKPLNMTKASAKPESGRFMNAPNVNDELTRMIQHTEEGYAVEDGYQQRDESSDEDMVDIDMLRRRLEQMTTKEEEDDDDLSDIADSISDEKGKTHNSVAADSVDKSGSSVGGMSDASELSEISFDSKYTTPRDKRGYVDTERDMRPKQNKPAPASYNRLKEEEEKRELLFKFEMLKKSYPTANIRQDFTIRSDIHDIKSAYEMSVRRLSMDSKIEKYKSYLMGAFMATEYVFGNFLGFDMQGYTQQQILQMNSYEKLLIEIGEKSYVPESVSKFPVEVRLLFLVVMNAAIFIGSKMLMAKTGANVLNMINSMNTNNKSPAAPPPQMNTQSSQPSRFMKRKMRGPSINVNDL
jgi:hypothetical protein